MSQQQKRIDFYQIDDENVDEYIEKIENDIKDANKKTQANIIIDFDTYILTIEQNIHWIEGSKIGNEKRIKEIEKDIDTDIKTDIETDIKTQKNINKRRKFNIMNNLYTNLIEAFNYQLRWANVDGYLDSLKTLWKYFLSQALIYARQYKDIIDTPQITSKVFYDLDLNHAKNLDKPIVSSSIVRKFNSALVDKDLSVYETDARKYLSEIARWDTDLSYDDMFIKVNALKQKLKEYNIFYLDELDELDELNEINPVHYLNKVFNDKENNWRDVNLKILINFIKLVVEAILFRVNAALLAKEANDFDEQLKEAVITLRSVSDQVNYQVRAGNLDMAPVKRATEAVNTLMIIAKKSNTIAKDMEQSAMLAKKKMLNEMLIVMPKEKNKSLEYGSNYEHDESTEKGAADERKPTSATKIAAARLKNARIRADNAEIRVREARKASEEIKSMKARKAPIEYVGGMTTRKKKYRKRNKTKRYKRQKKRYTKRYRMRY